MGEPRYIPTDELGDSEPDPHIERMAEIKRENDARLGRLSDDDLMRAVRHALEEGWSKEMEWTSTGAVSASLQKLGLMERASSGPKLGARLRRLAKVGLLRRVDLYGRYSRKPSGVGYQLPRYTREQYEQDKKSRERTGRGL